MAAVAAEPGPVAVPTTATDDEGQCDPGPGEPTPAGGEPDPETRAELCPVRDAAVPGLKAGDVALGDRGHVRPERETAAGRALCARAGDDENGANNKREKDEASGCAAGSATVERQNLEPFSPVPTEPSQAAYRSITDSQPSAVFLHSFPAAPPAAEAGLSLAEPAEPTTNTTANEYYQNRVEPSRISQPADPIYTALLRPEARPESPDGAAAPGPTQYTAADSVPGPDGPDQAAVGTTATGLPAARDCTMNRDLSSSIARTGPSSGGTEDLSVPNQPGSAADLRLPSTGSVPRRSLDSRSSSPCRSPKLRPTDTAISKPETRAVEPAPEPCGAAESMPTEPLVPGSEVRVSLDHIIDDALVVSFRLGEKLFSGVLMDLSKRFGPYGIPITVFPQRDYKDRPPLSLHEADVSRHAAQDVAPPLKEEPQEAPGGSQAPPPLPPWTSRPPPLFQDGAPYPPPLLIRDSYQQALPQPPPRRIRRPKRRYRYEEPTSIMNAIKLRPRQLLCDKCKGVVPSVGGPRELRRGAEDAARRRRDANSSSVVRGRHGDANSSSVARGRHGEANPSAVASKRHRDANSSVVGKRHGDANSSSVVGKRHGEANSSSAVGKRHGEANSSSVVSKRHGEANSSSVVSKRHGEANSSSVANKRHRDANSSVANKRLRREASSSRQGGVAPRTLQTRSASSSAQKIHFTRLSSSCPPPAPLPPRLRIKPHSAATLKGC